MKKMSLAELVEFYSKLPEQKTSSTVFAGGYTSKKLQGLCFADFDYCIDVCTENLHDLNNQDENYLLCKTEELCVLNDDTVSNKEISYADGELVLGLFNETFKSLEHACEYQKEVNRTLVKEIFDLRKEVNALSKKSKAS